ncbi:ABC transporter permease [Patulibacter sp. NPDC049589]|uniref:ABC transporter permease n=1 Tax=Patulibacter sp. NPDC049589 TaxID=3154731 RepID=UPI00343E27C3
MSTTVDALAAVGTATPDRRRRLVGRAGRRLLGAVGVLWAAATVTFLLQALMPGDRARLIINQTAGTMTSPTAEQRAAVNATYHLDDSLFSQYLHYIGGLAHGDLGTSYFQHQEVTKIIGDQIGATIVLTLVSLVLAWAIALTVTVLAAGRDNVFSRLASGFQIVSAAVPQYWVGTILLVVFSIQLGIFPVESGSGISGLVLPAITLALPVAGFLGQVSQDEFTRLLDQPFVTSSRTRGASDLGVRIRHVLRHAALPGVTLSGWALGFLFSGAVIVETVFARPGIGGVLVGAATSRDIPLVTGIVIVSAAVYVVANLLVDVAYTIIDPRLKDA